MIESRLSNSFRACPASSEYVNTLFIYFFSLSKFNFYFSDAEGGELTFGIKLFAEGSWLLPNLRKVVGAVW